MRVYTCNMSQPSSREVLQPWVALPCACATVRRLGRLATRLYDVEMRPARMETGQFTLLATIRRVPGISQIHIARRLGMDTTSLTRTLGVLLKHGWVEKAQGSDRRSRVFTITRAGEAQLLRARPYWQRAQDRFVSIVGADGAKALVEAVEAVALALNAEVGDLHRASRSARRGKRNARARQSSRVAR
jgi:DNA-binding MarR family transcriptional regulator